MSTGTRNPTAGSQANHWTGSLEVASLNSDLYTRGGDGGLGSWNKVGIGRARPAIVSGLPCGPTNAEVTQVETLGVESSFPV